MKLNDVCEFIIDCPHSTAKDEGKGYPLIRTPNIGKGRLILDGVYRVSDTVYKSRIQRGVPQDGDLIFAREAPAGNVAIITNGEKVCLGQRTVLIRPNKSLVDAKWLVYYLLSPQKQYDLLGTANGATVAHVNLPTIRNLNIKLPDMVIQNKIASILSTYDDLIENNRCQIALLEEAASRLYKEWFVDFHFPGHEQVKIVDGVPEGWEQCILKNLIDVKYGKDHKALKNGCIPVYGSGGYMRSVDKALFTGEAILIPRKGSLNNILYVNEAFWTVDTMFYAPMKRKFIAKYVYFYLKRHDMYSMNIGAAVPSMTANTLNNISINLPADEILKKFDEFTSDICAKSSLLRKQNHLLQEARDRLLPKLMNGEIEVRP